MTIDEIKELIHVVHDTGIAELEVQRGDERVRIRRAGMATQDFVVPSPTAYTPVTPIPAPQAPFAQTTPGLSSAAKEDERDLVVKSPIVGTYYDAPGPGAAPFVKVGDKVSPKQVLCIIESMKLMNEIEAEIAGTVISKFVENGRPVEYGESLFTIRPV